MTEFQGITSSALQIVSMLACGLSTVLLTLTVVDAVTGITSDCKSNSCTACNLIQTLMSVSVVTSERLPGGGADRERVLAGAHHPPLHRQHRVCGGSRLPAVSRPVLCSVSPSRRRRRRQVERPQILKDHCLSSQTKATQTVERTARHCYSYASHNR